MAETIYLALKFSEGSGSILRKGNEMRRGIDRLPNMPGTYLLLFHLAARKRVEVGRLGKCTFSKGWYAYVGSAFGPGGLAARLRRHLRMDKKQHWHVDYLRAAASVKEIWISTVTHSLEHRWAEALQSAPWTDCSVDAFGSSDCNCPSHLFHFRRRPAASKLKLLLGEDALTIAGI